MELAPGDDKENLPLVFKLPLKILLFVLLCFGVTEMSYRVYVLGHLTFRPVLFNSTNMLLQSGLIEQSAYPDIGYQLKPGLDTWYQALRFTTNSYGLADKEYEISRDENDFRIAVVGSSWSMATGVEQGDIYHSILEERLNSGDGDTNYEFLNFATENYGLREIVGTARERASEWDPDVYLLAITTYTAQLEWQEVDKPFEIPERTYPFFQSYVLRALGLNLYDKPKVSMPVLDKDAYLDGRYFGQIERAINEVHRTASANDAKVVVLWLSYATPGPEIEEIMRRKSEELGIVFVRGYDALWDPDQHNRFQRWRVDDHPNREGHEAIASLLLDDMLASGVLSGDDLVTNLDPAG